MAGPLQITYRFLIICFLFSVFNAQEKWNYSAEEMDQIKVDGETIRRLKENVRFTKTDQVILTDNAVQHIKDDILYMNGNTIMINGLDTLTCDSMVYWSELDSGYAMGNVHYVQPKNDRRLTTDILHYWQTEGYRGSSFVTMGYTQITEPAQLISANKISYDDDSQLMKLRDKASVENPTRGIFGDEIIIQYSDSLIQEINVTTNAFAYNELNIRLEENGPYRQFRDEMSSREMRAYFMDDDITQLELNHMATTLYHVINDSLLAGNNEASGDSIQIDFLDGNIRRIQVVGGSLGKFKPEGNNTKIDTTIFYGADYLDYHINEEKTYLSGGAYVEYQNTQLSAGEIMVDWKTNILDAVKINEEFPMVKTLGEEPMKGNSMVFDLVAKHGRIDQGRTSLNQSFYHGREVFRDDPNIFHVDKSKYTSCELDHPHFYLGSRKMKMIPGDKVIAKPLWLHIYDIPVIGIPLAVFPNKGGNRHSGWIMPSFESYNSIGTGFRNFGYYWAPNDYMDAKTTMNFFDKEGIQVNSNIKYKRRHGQRWYNHKSNGRVNWNFKRRITTNEITDLTEDSLTTEIFTLRGHHNQSFDPTQNMNIRYDYISDKDAYQNTQEVSLQNRLKQKLSTSFNYNKIWMVSSFGIGYSETRYLGIENNPPNGKNLYKNITGPSISYNINTLKIFGLGEKWYNAILGDYRIYIDNGYKYYYLNNTFGNIEASHNEKKISVQHKSNINAPTNMFGWLTLRPHIDLTEYWIWTYKEENSDMDLIEKEGFKRRLTWNSSISANTKIYGLLSMKIGRLNAIRHVMTPSISFSYTPDFSNPKFGYFQQNTPSGGPVDYFQDYSGTPNKERRYYTFSVKNLFQAKIRNEEGGYNKANFLSWNSRISYHPLRNNSPKLDEMVSDVSIKNLSGRQLVGISMLHNFYRLDDGDLINIWEGEFPRLTKIELNTKLQFKLSGAESDDIKESDDLDSALEDFDDEYNDGENQKKFNKDNGGNLWETELGFSYRTWKHPNSEWDYTSSLYTTHKISLSKHWSLIYTANFNLKEKEMVLNKFSIYRPLHCWEFSFNFWPQGISSGFSLEIKVKNPDLQDIKVISSDYKRGFSGY